MATGRFQRYAPKSGCGRRDFRDATARHAGRSAILPGPAWLLAAALSAAILVAHPAVAPQLGATAATAAEPAAPDDPLTLIRALNAERAAGRTEAALATCRRYLKLYPDDAGMQYNLACLQESAGERDAALESLATAIANGYDDFHRIESDADLAALAADPRYDELRAEREAQLAAHAEAGALSVIAGQRLTGVPLYGGVVAPNAASPAAESVAAASLDLRFEAGALALDLTLDDPAFRAAAPPWRGGSGLFVNLVVPDGRHDFTSKISFGFAFGMFQRRTTGAVLVAGDDEGERWQRVAELAPKLHIDERSGRVRLSALIPWRAVAPYHPLIDPELGLNVVYQGYRPDGRRWTAALIPDPAVPGAPHRWRRFVPLSLQPGAETGAQLAGRLSDTVITGGHLDLELAAWVPAAGPGALTIAVTDAAGQSVLSGGSRRDRQPLDAGTMRWRRTADLTALPTGPYSVTATLELPDGKLVGWSGPLLRLAPDWLAAVRNRLDTVPMAERTTVAYRIDAVADALQSRRPRQDPTPLVTTVGEIELMLRQADSSGSILPVAGRFLLVYPGPAGEDRLCTLQLPVGHGRGQPLLVGLPAADHAAAVLGRQIAQQLPPPRDLTVAVPHLPPADADADAAAALAAAAVAWLRDYLQPGETRLAGVDAGGGAALRLSLAAPDALDGVLLIAGAGFTPWPGSTPAAIARELSARHNDLHYDWVRFVAETAATGQADTVHAAMTKLGFRLGADETPDGGLSVSQASGRIARWAVAP